MRISLRFALLLLLIISITGFAPPKKKKIKYIDPANMDLAVKPGDNFYEYVNGTWLKNNPVPASKTRWGSFDELRELSTQRIKTILEEAASDTSANRLNQMIGDFYISGMDSAGLERSGYDPIKPDLQRIDAITDIAGVLNEIVYERKNGAGAPLFGFNIGQDAKNVNQYIVHVSQGGTSLPDRDYYLKNDKRSTRIREAYIQHLKNIFQLTGENAATATAHADAVMRIETALAKTQLGRVEMRDPDKTYNKFSVKDFSLTSSSFNWKETLAKFGVTGADSIITNNPSFFRTTDILLTALPVADWKTYLKWKITNGASPYLSDAFVKEDFSFSQVLS